MKLFQKVKFGLISEGILTLVHCIMTIFFTFMGGKFKLSAQESDLAPFVGNWTKLKMPSEIKLHLVDLNYISVICNGMISFNWAI